MNGKDKPIIRNLDKCELIDAIAKAKMMMDLKIRTVDPKGNEIESLN